MIAYWA